MTWGTIILKMDLDTNYWIAFVEGHEELAGVAAGPEHALRLLLNNLKHAQQVGRELPAWVSLVTSKAK